MKLKIYYIITLLLFSICVRAQTLIKGTVTDVNGNVLSGATVSYGSKTFSTDANGSFNIDCSKAHAVVVSYVGYGAKRVVIQNCNDELLIKLAISSISLNEVEISATSNPNKALIYQPQAITKLSAVEIKRATGLFFDDVININVPGVTFERRAVNSGQQFNIRGYGNGARGTRGANSNFDGQGYKVYLNGIPVTDAEGITVMDDIDFGSIGNVEVVKGPAGSLYGLAIAGAVNLKTIKPVKGKTSLGQEVMLGSYGLQRYTTTLQTAGQSSSLLLNYGNQKSNGYFVHNKSHKDFINLISEFQPKQNQSITAYVGYSNSYDERGGEQTIEQYEAKSDTGNFEYIKRNGHNKVITFRAGVGHTYGFNNWLSNTTSLFGTGLVNDASSAGGWTDKLSVNYGTRSVFETKFRLSENFSISGITGLELQRQNAQTIGYNMKANPADATPATWTFGEPYWVINANTSNTSVIAGTSSYFSEWTLMMPYDLSFTAGVGISNMKLHLEDRFNPATVTRPASFDTSYKNMVSPHFAVNKVFSKKASLYVSYSRGYKAPVSSYFFVVIPNVGANPARAKVDTALKPEVGDQIEIGAKGSVLRDKLYYEVSAFNVKFKDKMTAVFVQNPNDPAGATLYSLMTNAGTQNHKGLEALLRFTAYQSEKNFLRSIRPFANFTYSDFKYENFKFHQAGIVTKDSVVDYTGRPVVGIPKFTANAGLDFVLVYGIYGNITYLYRDKASIVSTEEFYSPPYSLLNSKLGIQKSLGKHISADVYVGVNNITNTQYPIKVFVNQLTTPLSKTSGDAYIPGPRKANYYGGLNLKYNF